MIDNRQSIIKAKIIKWCVRVFLIVTTLIMFYPFIWNILSSFKTNTEFLTDPFSLPKGFAIENYVRAFTKAKMADYFLNSIIVMVSATAIVLLFIIPTSYVLSRYKFFGSKFIIRMYMACIFIQATYIMVPLFLQLNEIRMLDKRFMLSLVYAVFQFPFGIFVLTGFIRTIPKEYEEAARIDGCSNFAILTKIIIPMAKSGLVTVGMLVAMGFWNEYPLALVLISSESKKTLPVGLANLFEVQRYATDWSALFAALVLVLIPTIIIYIFGQKQLLVGMNAGGLKG